LGLDIFGGNSNIKNSDGKKLYNIDYELLQKFMRSNIETASVAGPALQL